jgi:Zn-dependent protease
MKTSFHLGSVFGVAINVHFTWFIIFALITLSLIGNFAARFPELSAAQHLLIGVMTSLLFFGSILFHEMAHSLLALSAGKQVRSITLFIFGGVSEFEKEAGDPGEEIRVALVGPLSSYLLAAIFGGVWFLTQRAAPVISSVAGWLSVVNFALGTFNLLPGLPLDGGHVLRGIVWRATGNPERATQIAITTGRALGYGLILAGVWAGFRLHDLVGGLWLGFLGWFLVNAAEASGAQMQFQRAMAGVHAGEVMALDFQFVPGGTSVAEFVEQYLLHSGAQCFFVGEPERPRGIITLTDVRALPREEWRSASVQAVMRPLERVWAVAPGAEIEEVLRLMDAQNVAQIPVMENGHLLGLIRRDQLLHLILTRAELFNLRDEAKSAKA